MFMKKLIMFGLLILVFGACNESDKLPMNSDLKENSRKELVMAIRSNSEVVEVRQKYLGSVDNSDAGFRTNVSEYLLELRIQKMDDDIPYPGGLYFKGVEFTDNGIGYDQVAGDGLFTAKEKIAIVEEKPAQRKIGLWVSLLDHSNPRSSCIGCNNIDLVGPGEACLEEGNCPDFDWWSTWFCVCGSDCYFCIGDSCECENSDD